LSLAAGVACCSIALAEKPPLEKARPGAMIEPVRVAKVKRAEGGKFVIDGDWVAYSGSGFNTRNAPVDAPFFDCYGRGGALAPPPDAIGPGTLCVPACDTVPDTGVRWFFGTAYQNPNTIEDMQDCACPPSSTIDRIDLGWYWGPAAATSCVILYFPIEEVLAFNGTDCTDPSTMTDTGPGIALDFGLLAPGAGFYYYGFATGLSGFGLLTPATDDGGDPAYMDGSYQMIITSDTATGLVLAAGPTQPMLWGTGDSTAAECRPGVNNEDSFDDDAPPDLVFANPAECYPYTFGVCPDPLGKMNAFSYLRCPADLNNDGFVDGTDSDVFFNGFESGDPAVQICVDLNGDCFVDGTDSDIFNNEFESACP
jgi:hypothetical protein